jgi:hypothetical protein
VRLFTDKGAVELEDDFRAKGTAIRLGYDPSRPERVDESASGETTPLDLLLSDDEFVPLAGCTYHLVAGGRRLEGRTDGEGRLRADLPKEVKAATLRVWKADYPTGPFLSYALELADPMPPAASVLGMKHRLRNLGYYHGPIDDEAGPSLEAAIREFQEDHHDTHDLSVDGTSDAPTQGAIEDVHGS